jgi:isoleucyl-tRNA synthetase
MQGYRLYNVVPNLVRFIDDLTNWYVRRSRPRFWKSKDDADKAAAYATLYEVLTTFAKVLAPFMPFLTETIHQRLVRPVDPKAPQSVHFCDYPLVQASAIDPTLEKRMATARAVVALGRRLREDHKIKVRQPLSQITIVHRDATLRAEVQAMSALILEELNIKVLAVAQDESAFVSVSVKPNFKTLGKRAGPKLKEIGAALASFGHAEVSRLEAGESLDVAGEAIALADVILQRKASGNAAVATDGDLSVVLDTEVTEVLRREGIAREFISVMQNARRESGLEVSDRIRVLWSCAEAIVGDALREHKESIAREILAVELGEGQAGQCPQSAALNDSEVKYSLHKA